MFDTVSCNLTFYQLFPNLHLDILSPPIGGITTYRVMDLADDNPLWGVFGIIFGVILNRVINGKFPWDKPRQRYVPPNHAYDG